MVKKNDFSQHPFFEGQSHFQSNNFFTGKGTGVDDNGKRFFRRGDIKIVLLKLLQEQPRHGYELIKVLEERFKGLYSPSPGSVYPTLQMLEDQELVNIIKEGRKKVYHLTDDGQTYLEEHKNEDPFNSKMNMFENIDLNEMMVLRSEIQSLYHEFFLIGRLALENPKKKEQLEKLLEKTRKELSNIAKDDEENTDEQ
ncbi:PadR family transcriptional regulator [Peribacillus psychrosaccharolyticus]|uniref:PadR family transcriptional regulator n=1 Tax=Peribacillus psychrosaccharolyticus TaxID=1407 RepID=A0A974NKL3_PERPY|nr:PadR family transcriptional regulator [Peribacillus psychrosaccharolyticus]MEC2055780.1 PadR family transcriptional regulator [Peribacillus psychrosaccharolyticus]QQS99428.1 PadR family transcriptional regulator [Peribacillus psychrosaccharolyticus]